MLTFGQDFDSNELASKILGVSGSDKVMLYLEISVFEFKNRRSNSFLRVSIYIIYKKLFQANTLVWKTAFHQSSS